jgi:hypothetical protein
MVFFKVVNKINNHTVQVVFFISRQIKRKSTKSNLVAIEQELYSQYKNSLYLSYFFKIGFYHIQNPLCTHIVQ